MRFTGNTTIRSGVCLASLALIAVTLLSVVQLASRERSAANRAAHLNQQLDEVLARLERNNDTGSDVIRVSDRQLGTKAPLPFYRARMDGRATGIAMTIVASDGYSGEIRLLLGVDMSGTILGTRVLEHRETPGIGDRIERRRNDWITLMDGRSLNDVASQRWHTRKPDGAFDAITGATITSQAVVTAVRDALLWLEENPRIAMAQFDSNATHDPASVTEIDSTRAREKVPRSDTMGE